MEDAQIVLGDARQRLRRATARLPVRVKPVDQPVEQHRGDVARILAADAERRQRLLTLTIDLLWRERRAANDIGDEIQRQGEGVFHHDGIDEREIRAGSGSHGTANRIDLIGDLLGAPGGRSLVEQL
jgi:hypothetical protein